MRTRLGTRLKTSKTDTNNPSRLMTAFLMASISSSVWGIISIIPEARLNVDGGLSASENVRQSHLGGRLPAYDGRKSLYTAGPLPFTSRTFEITLQDEEDSLGGSQGGQRYDNAAVFCI